ncbi:hypothetical protein ACWC98_39295, partial [Streptomyces goshikiensis]
MFRKIGMAVIVDALNAVTAPATAAEASLAFTFGQWITTGSWFACCGRLPRSGAGLRLSQVARHWAQGQHSAGGAGVFGTGIAQGG